MGTWQHALVVGYGGIGAALCQTLQDRAVANVTALARGRVPHHPD